jgi:hypothetical protein
MSIEAPASVRKQYRTALAAAAFRRRSDMCRKGALSPAAIDRDWPHPSGAVGAPVRAAATTRFMSSAKTSVSAVVAIPSAVRPKQQIDFLKLVAYQPFFRNNL